MKQNVAAAGGPGKTNRACQAAELGVNLLLRTVLEAALRSPAVTVGPEFGCDLVKEADALRDGVSAHEVRVLVPPMELARGRAIVLRVCHITEVVPRFLTAIIVHPLSEVRDRHHLSTIARRQ